MISEAEHSATIGLFGLGTFLAIVLHKPLDAFAITMMMSRGAWTRGQVFAVNLAFSLLCPIGAAAFLLGTMAMSQDAHLLVGCALAFSAGAFLTISLADLLPEIQFHSHHRVSLSMALLLGVMVAWGIRFLEPSHLHEDVVVFVSELTDAIP